MPNIKSAKKRVKVAERNNLRNVHIKSKMRTAVKSVKLAIAAGDLDLAKSKMALAFKEVDMAAQKKVIHKNKAARYKARLAKLLKAAEQK